MIKIFENNDWSLLEKQVNEYLETCGSKVSDIQFRTNMTEGEILFHVCIVHDLDFLNMYK